MIRPDVGRVRDWTIAGVPTDVWLNQHRRELVSRTLHRLRADGDAERELRWIVDYNVSLYIRMLSEPGLVLDESVATDLVASAARRASEGSSIDDVIRDYVNGTAIIWRAIVENLAPDEFENGISMTDVAFDYLRQVSALVLRGFHHEAARMSIGERDARYSVYSALLTGNDPEAVAQRAGVRLATRYLVLTFRISDSVADVPRDPDLAPQVITHRRANIVHTLLDSFGSGDALALVRDPVGTALVPLPSKVGVDEKSDVRNLVDQIRSAVGSDVYAGAAVAVIRDVPAAVQLTEELLELSAAIAQPPGAWFLSDLLVPYQLTRPGPARDQLAERMRILDHHPDWESTLRSYIRSGYDRRRTASLENIHPNTVDYRIARVADASGLDAGDPAMRPAALAALYVRDVERG